MFDEYNGICTILLKQFGKNRFCEDLGPRDCALLPLERVNLQRRMISVPRPKTGVDRCCPLWPETVDAIKNAIAKRPTPRLENATKLVFITSVGRSFVGVKSDRANQVSAFIRKLMIEAGDDTPGRPGGPAKLAKLILLGNEGR